MDFEDVKCNLCGADDYKILIKSKYEKQRYDDLIDKFRSSGDETLIDQVVQCKKCGLIYINPRLKSEDIVKGYSEGEDENFVSQAKGREITFEKNLKLIEKYYKVKGKILDIGTAGGTFLHVAKKHGWDVYGIEPNKWLCKWGKEKYGIEILPGILFDHKKDSNE